MNRRQLMLSLGTFAAGSVGVVGSGAFSSVSANRGLDLRVARDPNAYLGLQERTDGVRSYVGDGEVNLRFPGLEDPASGNGPAPNSVYEFDETGFIITNQGTEEVNVFARQEEDEAPYVEIYDHTDESREALTEDSPETLTTGDSVTVGIRIDTRDLPGEDKTKSYERTLSIRAKETS